MMRYFQAASGPIGTAVAHFLLSLVLLHGASPDVFGKMSFLLVASQFGAGVWGALFCAPLPVMLVRAGGEKNGAGNAIVRCFFASNLIGAVLALFCFWATACGVGMTVIDAGLFAAYCAVYLLRWFARANAYVAVRPLAALSSDLLYSLILVVSLTALALWPALFSVRAVCGLLLLAATLSMLPFGTSYLRAQFLDVSPADCRHYLDIWRQHSSWSLVGVVTTEATANSHAYLLAIFAGPGAFAPIAASALLIRPIGVVVNALTEMERPHVARLLGAGQGREATTALSLFRLIVLLAWCGGAVTAIVLLAFAPHLLFPKTYALRFLVIGTALWMLVMFARLWRAPDSVLLQAAGEFKTLARASVVSAVASIVAVIGLLLTVDTVWSVAGILAGEALCTVWTSLQARRYRRNIATRDVGALQRVTHLSLPVATNGMDEK